MRRWSPAWCSGGLVPGLNDSLNAVKIGQTSLPIALGLLLMMYPVLAKVRYREIGLITADRRMMAASLILNWVVGPAVMFALAWLLLPDQPAYRTGVILVGLARCIAMVLIWTDLAHGDREMAAVLVALNAVFQVLTYAALGVFYLNVLPGWLGLHAESLAVSMGQIGGTVLVFLGIPLVAGYLTRTLGERARGQEWYETRLLPRIAPIALYGLLFTITVLFALQGDKITSEPLDVARIALPLLAYFAIMWFGGFWVARRLHQTYERTASLAFSAASNDFELAIAVAIGVFGVTSGEALAGVVGPLIEVPVLLGLVYVALWLHRRLSWPPAGARLTGARATSHDGGSSMSGRPSILFACRANAGRSVTAKVLAEHYAAGAVEVSSAGSEPGDAVHPEVASVLADLGLSTEQEVPNGFDPNGRYDVVVTMGCGQTCPVYLGARYEDWALDDPKGQDEPTVRRIVADIDRRVRQLLAQLVPDLPATTSVLDEASMRPRS